MKNPWRTRDKQKNYLWKNSKGNAKYPVLRKSEKNEGIAVPFINI
jgi:hypothetical protein